MTFGASAAHAAVTISIKQNGSSVVAVASGTLDLTGMTLMDFSAHIQAYVQADRPAVMFGIQPSANLVALYNGFTSTPSGFGTGPMIFPSTTSGTIFGVTNDTAGVAGPAIAFGQAFASGGTISSTNVWTSKTLTSLGLVEGQYVWTLSNDTIAVTVGNPPVVPAVPEPATWATMLIGFGAIGGAMRRRTVARVRFV